MIKVFSSENINRSDVISLWVHSFGDSIEYVEFFLDNCPDYICIEYFEDNKLVAMFFLLDGELGGEKSKYLYAACTHKEYRRRGIMERLIDFSKKYCLENGYSSIFLVPADEGLYNYYSKFGFVSSFRKKYFSYKTMTNNCIINTSVDIDDIFYVKKDLLNKIDCFCFSDATLKYTIKEHLFNNGVIIMSKNENAKLLAFAYFMNNELIVKEFLSENFNISTGLLKLFCNNSSENIYFYSPVVYNNKDIVEKYTKCGMCFPLNKKLSEFIRTHTDLYAGMYLD